MPSSSRLQINTQTFVYAIKDTVIIDIDKDF